MIYTTKEFDEAKSYWLDKLSGELSEVQLLKDSHRSESYEGADFKLIFASKLTERLLKISKNNDLSLYVLLITAFKILLYKYTGKKDIIISSPIYGTGTREYNKWVALRDILNPQMTFKELLINVKQTVMDGYKNQYYPIRRLLELLGIEKKISLFRVILLLQNIHEKEFIEDLVNDFENDITLSIHKKSGDLEGNITYNSHIFKKETIQMLADRYLHLLEQVLNDVNIKMVDIEALTGEEKNKIRYEFNNTAEPCCHKNKTLHELFEEQVERTPDHVAVSDSIDLSDIYQALNSEKTPENLLSKIETCCFEKNPYIYEYDWNVPGENLHLKILKTNHHNSVVTNTNMVKLLHLFDGERNIKSIFSQVKHLHLRLPVYSIGSEDVMEIANRFSKQREILLNGGFEDFVHVVKALYENYLIELVGIDSGGNDPVKPMYLQDYFDENESLTGEMIPGNVLTQRKKLSNAQVLLLGDTPGMATTGLLYIASYLRRNGIKAYVQFNDPNSDGDSLRTGIEELLREINPTVVAVSMKWFLHIARVIEICKVVKGYSADIKVVVGGNTASYYPEDIIRYEWVDCVIRGDGELPLLEICRGAELDSVANCVYRKDGRIVKKPITYVQDKTNSQEIYLSHLDEILISNYSSIFGTFFIYTQKGCGMHCFFCAGCNRVQREIFNRPHLVIREPEQVRRDIREAMKYASNLKFDFDVVDKNLLDYCKKIWDGIDLSSHFCTITNLLPPPPELIEYVNKKFKYVYWNIDIASLSQRHREKLVSLGLVKPQPGDEEIIAFLDECDRYDNTEFIINLIAGLPYFNKEDIAASQEMLTYIMDNYTCFSELFWARLHAQPGAPVVEDAETYGMHSYAKTFADYLKYSRMNLEGSVIYPTVEYSHYPYIYYNNDEFNSKISKYYSETASALVEYKENKRKALHAGRTLSYRELNQRVNQLAWLLRKKGVKRNSIVGIMMTHSIDLITALLAVLKAGGAYLPVDPDYPAARRKFMLKDSGLNVLLTQKHFLEKDKELFTDFPLGNVIIVDDKNIYKDDGPTLGVVNKPEDLLYVIYTSGSTGRPKGVMIPHKNFVNLVEFHRKIFGENPLSRVSQVASLGFDAMAFEVWPCLSSGASLYIADDDTRLDPSAMKEWLIKNEITISFQPTIMAEHLLRLDWPGKRVALKALRAAGDKLTCYPTHEYPFRFYNLYGPTEDTVWTTWREVGVKTDSEKAPDIGKPTGNKRVYIIGPDWEIQPIGIAGELCISGDGLAWGYLNNPELTAEKFVENPYESHPDKRMYRSGDLARWLTDGNLEFLGRIDQQVKLRGFRIELGEIENHLLNRDDVKHVVVIAREDSSGDKYLCAYIVLDLPHPLLEKEFDISQLREYLAKRLPEYMIPTYFIQLERIPLTPNGKTDIRALPEPKYGKKEAGFVAPRNALEEKLVEIWSGILGIEKETIGIDDKFFELGGHSLKATQMMSEIHKKLNVKVPLVEIFKIPSIRGLSKFISSSPQDKYIALEKVGEREHYPLSSAQKRLYIMQQMEPQSLGYNLPTFVVLEEKVEIEELKAVFRKLIDRHESLRTSFEISGEEPVQRINKGVDFEFEYYESEKQEAIEIAKRFIRPFDLSRAPLMRVGFIRLKEGRQVLMVDMHHIVTDGSSMEILVKEFMLLYKGIELPPLNIQYKDYAVWQNSESWREVIMSQEEYWMEEFKNDPPLMDISTDFPRPRGKSFEGNSLEFEIGKEETIKLRVLANRIDATLYIVMLSLFYIFLSKLSGEEDIVVGTPLEGRNHGDLGSVIGMFVNTLVLRNYPVGEKTFYEFLREIKDRVLRAFENQDYQFEDLVERLGIKRDSSRNPLFDVLFAFQNLDEQIEDVSREKMVESFDFGFKPIQFDLILTGVEEGEKLSFIFEYCTKLFEKRTIERYIAYFKDIISTILENNNIKLADITIIRHLSSARAYIPEMAINF